MISEPSPPWNSLERLAIHSITTRPWPLETAVEKFSAAGVGGISVWVEALEGWSATAASELVRNAGLRIPALVRGGFFCDSFETVRRQRIDENRRLIDMAQALSAEMLVLVVGAVPREPLARQRAWVTDALSHLLDHAAEANVKLAIEPLHPMYAANKSCINRLTEAREICESFNHPRLGVAVDVYHVWWDPLLASEIQKLGQTQRIFGFHLCDWRVPTRDFLNDRALMGDGCIDLVGICRLVESAGFQGWHEIEIFSEEHWARKQSDFLSDIIERYRILIQQST